MLLLKEVQTEMECSMKRCKHLMWVIPFVVAFFALVLYRPAFAEEQTLLDDGVFKVTLLTAPEINQGGSGLLILTVQNLTEEDKLFDGGIYIPEVYLRSSMTTTVTAGTITITGAKKNGVSWKVTVAPGKSVVLMTVAPAITTPGLIPDFYWVRMVDQFHKFPLKIVMVNLSMAYLPIVQEASAVSAAATDISDSGLFTQSISGGISSIQYDSSLLEGARWARFIVTVRPNDEPGDIFTIWVRFPAKYLRDSIKYKATGQSFLYPETEDEKVNELQWVIGLTTEEETLTIDIPIVEATGGTTMTGFYLWQLQDGEPFQSRDLKILPIRSRIYIVIAQNGPSPIQPAGE